MRKTLYHIEENSMKYGIYGIIASAFVVTIGFFLRSSVLLDVGYLLVPLSFMSIVIIHLYLCISSGIRYFDKKFKGLFKRCDY